uniref:Bacteriocin n=1 Tax=Lactococcus lactis subsp. lactis TaxID=1360 RepID=BCN1_LACLL|nr:RecName: Full=Bacteriocin [Lactococcus lactis subsp. lactis]
KKIDTRTGKTMEKTEKKIELSLKNMKTAT